jgi:hypothetical protein
MKTTTKLITLIFALLLFSNCLKEDCDNSTENKYVDKNYLPYIIPYSDTSTRLFLKNGKDTLLFKSQELKETIEIEKGNDIGNCKTYKLQQYILKMAASDTDFFEVKYFAITTNVPKVQYSCYYTVTNKIDDSRYINFFQLKQLEVLNHIYDSVSISPNKYGDTVYTSTKFGVLRIKALNNIYQLIK